MKKTLAVLSVAAFALMLAALPLFIASPLWDRTAGRRWLAPAYDLGLSLTELKCLRMGLNPYDVWHGDVVVAGVRPSPTADGLVDWSRYRDDDAPVNVVSPWAYTVLLPLGFLPEPVAVAVYIVLETLCLAVLFAVSLYWGRVLGLGRWDRMLAGAVPILAVSFPVLLDYFAENFALFVLAAAALMTVCLHRGRGVLAGVCWAVAMLKPQAGLAFAVPLLLRRQWAACFTAAGLCLALSVPPARMCHTSVVTMIAQTPTANTMQFLGCGTFPYALCSFVPQTAGILIALGVGATLVFALTRLVCRARPEALSTQGGGLDFLSLMPAALCASTWTFANPYSHVMGWFFCACLALALAKTPRSPFLWGLAVLSAPFIMRLYNVYGFISCKIPALACSLPLHRHLDGLNSTVNLILCAVLCVWMSRPPAPKP